MDYPSNFIKTIIENDIKSKKHSQIITRFPPEPNGFLHIGHARAIITNFELAKEFGGYTNLRYDDTNPIKEDEIYVKSILEDIKWLGYVPKNIFFASNYFQEMFDRAVILIKKGLAYVDDQTQEEIAKTRGNLVTKGIESIFRNRKVEENLLLFSNMRDGKYKEGEKVLRAKIDMASPNMNMRDPVIYRISFVSHHNTKDKWCIYPMYDYAHPLEDSIEGITHSLCSLEFEDHRPLYDWYIKETEMKIVPRQIEFGRLNIENTIMSKRYLRELVETKKVFGWDDPRMPTISAFRRKGYTKEAIRAFIFSTGLSKINSVISKDMLDHSLREDLKLKTSRVMAVIEPLKVTITNYEDGKIEYLDVENNSDNLELGKRKVPFSKNLYIEREDFIVTKPNNKYKRLSLNDEVRLFNAYFIKCNDVIYDENNEIKEILVTYDKATKSGTGFNERKPNGTIHFVCAEKAVPTQFNFFEPMLIDDNEDSKDMTLLEKFNDSSWVVRNGFVEEYLKNSKENDKYQFVRKGYFNVDKETTKDKLIFNEITSLKSSFK